MKVFLSHSTLDQALASALQMLLNGTFGEENIELVFSSDEEGGGIPVGHDWLKWIKDSIKAADRTFILVTPKSVNSPWVMWEGGVATGVALGSSEDQGVVPIVFGVPNDKIPSPFNSVQFVRGDNQGITKLLRDVRKVFIDQGSSFPPIDASIKVNVPAFLEVVKGVTRESMGGPILASIPNLFNAHELSGYWVSCFDFGRKCHAEIAHIRAISDREVQITNHPPTPRTEGRDSNPFRNVIEAQVVNRHLIGHWKNVSDTRYFGTLHLAVNSSDNNMKGQYTSFANDVKVERGSWKWCRLDPETISQVDLETFRLRHPREVLKIVTDHLQSRRQLDLNLLVEPPE